MNSIVSPPPAGERPGDQVDDARLPGVGSVIVAGESCFYIIPGYDLEESFVITTEEERLVGEEDDWPIFGLEVEITLQPF